MLDPLLGAVVVEALLEILIALIDLLASEILMIHVSVVISRNWESITRLRVARASPQTIGGSCPSPGGEIPSNSMIHPWRLILEPLWRHLFLLLDLRWRGRWRHHRCLALLDQLSGLLMKSLLSYQLRLPFLELCLPELESLVHLSKPLLLLSDLC
jgi:hypothetical protein